MQSMALSALVCSLAQLARYGARSVKRISFMVFPLCLSGTATLPNAQKSFSKFGNSYKILCKLKMHHLRGALVYCSLLIV